MMRITRSKLSDGRTRLKLEGSLIGQWAALLAAEGAGLLRSGVQVSLDLMEVDFVDRLGVEALRHLGREGVELLCRHGAVACVLEGEGVPVTTVPDANGRNHAAGERR